MIKTCLPCFAACAIASIASADARDWRISVTCDADERAATVRMMSCDANAPDGEASCFWREDSVSAGARSVSTITNAGTELFTPVRPEPSYITFLGAHPSEFGCVMPASEGPDRAEGDPASALFLRIERAPTTFNYQGKCGAAPDNVSLMVQHGTASLNMNMPFTNIEMASACGWGDPLPITEVTINADTGNITERAYDEALDRLTADASSSSQAGEDEFVSSILPPRPQPVDEPPVPAEPEIDRNAPIRTQR